MKRFLTPLLLTLLVFPGTGHLYLKYRKTGAALVIISLAALAAFIIELFRIVWKMMEEFAVGNLAADQTDLTAIIHGAIPGTQSGLLTLSLTILLCCWLVSILDILRLALHAGQNAKKTPV